MGVHFTDLFEEHKISKVSVTEYIFCLPDYIQEQIQKEVRKNLIEKGECTPENVERAMQSRLCDLEEVLDIKKYEKLFTESTNRAADNEKIR